MVSPTVSLKTLKLLFIFFNFETPRVRSFDLQTNFRTTRGGDGDEVFDVPIIVVVISFLILVPMTSRRYVI